MESRERVRHVLLHFPRLSEQSARPIRSQVLYREIWRETFAIFLVLSRILTESIAPAGRTLVNEPRFCAGWRLV